MPKNPKKRKVEETNIDSESPDIDSENTEPPRKKVKLTPKKPNTQVLEKPTLENKINNDNKEKKQDSVPHKKFKLTMKRNKIASDKKDTTTNNNNDNVTKKESAPEDSDTDDISIAKTVSCSPLQTPPLSQTFDTEMVSPVPSSFVFDRRSENDNQENTEVISFDLGSTGPI